MGQLMAFTKKEVLEQVRTGKLWLLLCGFCLFGIMNPAIAKLTPRMMEMMSDQLAEYGMAVTGTEADAMASWAQFYKNMPIMLIVFLLLFSGIFTAEYQSGTLINILAKGMGRWKIFASKMGVMLTAWTLGCLICYGITFGGNAYFWDNGTVHHVCFAAFCFYLFGVWLVFVFGMASVLFNSPGVALLVAGAAFIASHLLALIPAIKEYLPSYLFQPAELLAGTKGVGDYLAAVLITGALIVAQIILSVAAFNKKSL